MDYMNCNACKKVVQTNCVGICVDCQMGKGGLHAFQERRSKKVDVRKQAKDGQAVASRNSERQEATQESKKEGFEALDPELLCSAMVGVIGLDKTKKVIEHYHEVNEQLRGLHND